MIYNYFAKKKSWTERVIRLTKGAKQNGFRKNNEDVVKLCAEVGNHYEIYNKWIEKGNWNYIEDISI